MDKYSSYKDSGFIWMGKIPSHWSLLKSKFLWRESFNTSATGTEDLLSVSQYDGVTLANGSRSESLIGYKVVEENNLVINIMLAWMGGLGVSAYNGLVSPAYCVYKLQGNNNPKYMHYLYKTPMYLAEFARHSTGVIPSRWRMYTNDFGQILTLIPPQMEQDAIVAYLDAATAKIDEAIAQQQRMIDLLNERKQIVINNAVTRGVSSCITYRESGYDWIGVIPSHWEIRKLKYYVTPSREKAYKALPYIGLENIESHTGKFILTDSEYDINQSLLCNKNDVIFGKLRPYLAKAYLCDRNYCCSNEFVVMRDTPVPKFLQYVLLSTYFVNKVDASTYGAKMPRADIDYILNLPIAIPPVNEQGEIVRSLNEQFSIIDKMIAPKAKLLSLLQERKQIIINDVVTGKVKVF